MCFSKYDKYKFNNSLRLKNNGDKIKNEKLLKLQLLIA